VGKDANVCEGAREEGESGEERNEEKGDEGEGVSREDLPAHRLENTCGQSSTIDALL